MVNYFLANHGPFVMMVKTDDGVKYANGFLINAGTENNTQVYFLSLCNGIIIELSLKFFRYKKISSIPEKEDSTCHIH